jgi:hypothetical protein
MALRAHPSGIPRQAEAAHRCKQNQAIALHRPSFMRPNIILTDAPPPISLRQYATIDTEMRVIGCDPGAAAAA